MFILPAAPRFTDAQLDLPKPPWWWWPSTKVAWRDAVFERDQEWQRQAARERERREWEETLEHGRSPLGGKIPPLRNPRFRPYTDPDNLAPPTGISLPKFDEPL